jgi:hypothetical protein
MKSPKKKALNFGLLKQKEHIIYSLNSGRTVNKMKAYQKETELTDREFEDILDELYPDVNICGMKFSPGHALRMLDEVAFDQARNDYTDSFDQDNPVWICEKCESEFDNEDDAEECCKEEQETA